MLDYARLRQAMQQIHDHPEEHNQNSFWNTTSCGTTRCLAGWVTHFAGDATLPDVTGLVIPAGGQGTQGTANRAAELLGLFPDGNAEHSINSTAWRLFFLARGREDLDEEICAYVAQDAELAAEAYLENDLRDIIAAAATTQEVSA